jgi:hypothetical protein
MGKQMMATATVPTASTTPMQQPQAGGVEKRAHIRWYGDAPHPVFLIQGRNRRRCAIKDISAGGVALTRDFDVWPGERVAVEINEMVRLPGTVLRLGVGMLAIKFQLPRELEAKIDQAIQLGLNPAEW